MRRLTVLALVALALLPASVTQLHGFWTIAQCVEALDHSVSEATLRREVKAGRLKTRRIGRCLRVTEEELDRWRREGGAEDVAS